ncbi:MAG TPA: transposase [Bacteroidales bacterium]|nr:transposase [Bacteroidales bacterium]
MGTFTQTLYQVVFREKLDSTFLDAENSYSLFAYMAGTLENKNCHPFAVGGFKNHIHLLFDLHPVQSLSSLIKDIKLASNKMMKNERGLFQNFNSWQNGYGAFTYHVSSRNNLIGYVNGQEEHHANKSYTEELIELLTEHGLDFDWKYLF